MKNLIKLNAVSKILLIIIVALVFYFAAFSILKPFFITQPTPMMSMMQQMIGSDMLNLSQSASINIIALIAALVIALIISFYLFKHEDKPNGDKQSQNIQNETKITEKQKYELLKSVMSSDEKAILEEIQKAGEITQDSLVFRLNWSRAKVSTMLTNLDRKNIIQRERVGKTYKVHLNKRF